MAREAAADRCRTGRRLMDSPQADGEVMAESALLAQQLPEDPPDDGGGARAGPLGCPRISVATKACASSPISAHWRRAVSRWTPTAAARFALPGEGASGEDWAAFYGKVGWARDRADGYRVPRNLPNGFRVHRQGIERRARRLPPSRTLRPPSAGDALSGSGACHRRAGRRREGARGRDGQAPRDVGR